MSYNICLLVLLLTIGSAVQHSYGNHRRYPIPDRICGTLFSANDFDGDTLVLKDFDQSVNLKRDYRKSLAGWSHTDSVEVEIGCRVTVCSDTYFQGKCILLTSDVSMISSMIPQVSSVNCTCNRQCKCEDIHIGKDEYGRAYLHGGCGNCDTEYVRLWKDDSFPSEHSSSITALTIRPGCFLRMSGVKGMEGTLLQGFFEDVSTYAFSCADKRYVSPSDYRGEYVLPEMILLPATSEELYTMLSSKYILSNHPGFGATLSSSEHRKSARNAYVIVLGTATPRLYGFHQCKDSRRDQIGECRIPVNMKHLGISFNTELCVISVPIAYDSLEDDYRLVASLDLYLSSHEHLKDVLPNAVIVPNRMGDEDITTTTSGFQRRLQALNALRGRLVDETYSNVIFILNGLQHLSSSVKRKPEAKLAQFENAVTQHWQLPPPIVIISRSKDIVVYVNGFQKMENLEYWPRNLEVSLENLCEKSGDLLGKEIFKEYYHNREIASESLSAVNQLLSPSEGKINQFRNGVSISRHFYKVQKDFYSAMRSVPKNTHMEFGDFLPERVCATLFSTANFEGNTFDLMDFDHSVNLRKDYRASLGGWKTTGSIQVNDECTITLCSDSYFLGNCHSLSVNAANISLITSTELASARCSCDRSCKCENVHIPNHEFGRAYLKGGCNTCDAQYISLKKAGNFPDSNKSSVEAIVVRKGCMLTIYSNEWHSGTSQNVTTSVVQNFQGALGSYLFSCVEIVRPVEELAYTATDFSILSDTHIYDETSNQLGLQAASKSRRQGRSFRNAYVFLIGTHQPKYAGFPQCKDGSENRIGECRIPLNISELQIANTELRVVTVPVAVLKVSKNDSRLLASLDEYLSTNQDLQDQTIPNAIIVYHRAPFKYFSTAGSDFQRKLQALHAFRERVLDESYSNVVYLLDNVEWPASSNSGLVNEGVAQIETLIKDEWSFSVPTVIVTRSDAKDDSIYVNGYRKLDNQQFWPLHLELSLLNLCKKRGDQLGQSIFKAVFQKTEAQYYNTKLYKLIRPDHTKVGKYRDVVTCALLQQPLWRNSKRIEADLKNEKEVSLMDSLNVDKVIARLKAENEMLKAELDEERRNRQEEVENIKNAMAEMADVTSQKIWVKLDEELKKLTQ